MESLRGQLLIASPRLPDSNFARTVVLLVEHHEQGALGVILNRPTGVDIQSFWKDYLDGEVPSCEELLSVGGPCEGQIFCVHMDAGNSEGRVLENVYVSSGPDSILNIVNSETAPFRVFIGYAGWGAGQLESELEVGGWLTMKATTDHIFGADLDTLWRKLLKQKGESVLRDVLNIRQIPESAELN
ncbi:MAG: YqgE/AlgH family protein [Verrucomicrobiota bacterium]